MKLGKRQGRLFRFDFGSGHPAKICVERSNYLWRLRHNTGCMSPAGYIRIRFDGKYYQAHRLAILYMTDKWPEKEMVDHIDTVKSNNRYLNLREATRSENGYNRPHQIDNKLETKGVHLHFGKYLAQMTIDGKPRYLGVYDTLEEASFAYNSVTENIQGEFAYQMENENV